MKYILEVENWDEDIFTLDDEYNTLKEAIEEARSVAYQYKAIGIIEIDENGNEISTHEIYEEVE